jgi:hypothetical protein
LLLGGLSPLALAYDASVHQSLTFLAAKQLQRCLPADAQPFTALEVRAIAASAADEVGGGTFGRPFRWQYHDPIEREEGWLDLAVSTRLNAAFAADLERLARRPVRERGLRVLGRVVGRIQLVTAPVRALPVFAPRFWRGNLTDRFEQYPVRESILEARLAEFCSELSPPLPDLGALLAQTAAETRGAVDRPLGGFPATWRSFWTPAETLGDFGSYGPAGNSFGRYVEFPCGKSPLNRCVLITDDPAYTAFADDRHLAAVRATARAMVYFAGDQPPRASGSLP